MPDTAQYRLGRAIRRVRRYHDLSQEALAEKAGMNIKHLGEIERGRKNVQWTTIVRIATALDVPVSTIVRAYEDG